MLDRIHSHPELHAARGLQIGHPRILVLHILAPNYFLSLKKHLTLQTNRVTCTLLPPVAHLHAFPSAPGYLPLVQGPFH